MKQLSFFNTTNLGGAELKQSILQAETQEDKILSFFQKHHDHSFPPHRVQDCLLMHKTPLTSIRRAMTCLTDKGKLVKTDEMVTGLYGKPTYTWRLA